MKSNSKIYVSSGNYNSNYSYLYIPKTNPLYKKLDVENIYYNSEFVSYDEKQRRKKVKFRQDRLNKIINRTNKSKSKGNG